ncbi:MAG: homoserine kinase [Anaerolineales bacterium]|jgi:homoserine kinase type II
MARYTILQQKDIQKIVRYYGLTINSFEAILGGAGNSSYLLRSTKGDFVLTVFNSKEWIDVINLRKLLNYLDKNEFNTTKLLPRLDGAYVTKFKNFPVLIKHYIRGKVYEKLTNKMLRQTGKELARLHKIPPPDYLPLTHSYGRQVFTKVIGKGIDLDFEAWLAGKQRRIKKQLPKKLPRGLIHGDLFYDNVLFKGNEMLTLIDFEEACNYFFIFDVGMGILGQCREGNSISLKKAKEFVSGYQKVRKLEKIGKEKLKLFVEYAAVATSYWRFWNYHIFIPTPEKQKTHRKMMQIADHIRAISPRDFSKALFGTT